METTIPNINLISNDGMIFNIPLNVANQSKYVSMMVYSDYPTDRYVGLDTNDINLDDITIPVVNGEILDLVVQFMSYYIKDPMVKIEKPMVSHNIGDNVQRWYASFIMNMPEDILFCILNIANFMDIQPLVELSCAAIACYIVNRSCQENIEDPIGY